MSSQHVEAVSAENFQGIIDHPSGYLALSPRNRRFRHPGLPGFIAYREQGRHLVVFGGVHAPPRVRAALLDEFLKEAARLGRRVLTVQLRADQVLDFAERGFTVNQLGTTFALKLQGYSFSGTKKMKLRNKIKRARDEGLCVVELGRELPRDAVSFASIQRISEAWLARIGKKELDFMIGELGKLGDRERRIFVTLDGKGQPCAFITYVPVWGEWPGYLHDLTRRLPDAPTGAMELCNAEAITRMRSEGVQHLHFGFTPFIVDDNELPAASRIVSWIIRQLRRHGQAIYPAETQAAYKLKWGTDITAPEYIAARPLSLRAIYDLLMLTRSI